MQSIKNLNEAFDNKFNQILKEEKEIWQQVKDRYKGKEVIFNPRTDFSDWGLDQEEIDFINEYVGQKGIITGLETGAMDSLDFDDYYWNVKFDNGETLDGISGYELDLLEDEEY